MKKCYLLITALIFAFSASAQDMGKDYFAIGELDKARAIFENQDTGNSAETNWYLGEIAWAQDKPDAARSFFEKGLAIDPENLYCQVGIAKVNLKSNPSEVGKTLEQMAKKNKKNPELLVAIARAYYDNGMDAAGDSMLEAAESAGSKSGAANVLRGDRMKAAKDPGGAAGQYEQAILKNQNNLPAYISIARIYMHTNPTVAIERLRELESRKGDNPIVESYLARVYFTIGKYADAIAIYKKLYNAEEQNMDVLTYYAASLFFTEQYDEATKLTQQGLKIDPDNFVLNRLRMYSELSRKDYAAGLEIAEKFFNLPVEQSEYIARDFMTYGQLLEQNGQIDEAIAQYDKALAIPETSPLAIKQVADDLNKKYPEAAAKYYQQYVDALGEEAQAADFFTMGQSYYKAATLLARDTVDVDAPARLAQSLEQANKSFAVVSERIPENHLGPIFQARVNALQDPETTLGLAKPYYEKVVEIILSKDDPSKNSRELIEAYRYLSYYYYLQYDANKQAADKAATLDYCAKILELDPTNDVAHQLQDALTNE